MHKLILIHISLCVLNFMLPAYRLNFAEVARTKPALVGLKETKQTPV